MTKKKTAQSVLHVGKVKRKMPTCETHPKSLTKTEMDMNTETKTEMEKARDEDA